MKKRLSKEAAILVVNRYRAGLPTHALVLQEAIRVLSRSRKDNSVRLPRLPETERLRQNMTLLWNLGKALKRPFEALSELREAA